MPAEPDNNWQEIVELHNHTKSICLLAEEADRDFKNYFQPAKEQRDALDHIIRAKCAEIGLIQKPNDDLTEDDFEIKYPSSPPADYSIRSMDKALGHEYRAFFDAADWLGVRLREKTRLVLEDFSPQCIVTCIPDYYPKIRPSIDQICKDIAHIRESKDINRISILEDVKKYRVALGQLASYYETSASAVPVMVEWTANERRRENKDVRLKILIPILCVLIGIFLKMFF